MVIKLRINISITVCVNTMRMLSFTVILFLFQEQIVKKNVFLHDCLHQVSI